MALNEALLAEWDQEMVGTRKVLERIPDAQHGWAPHAKSMTLGKLGSHVATMGMWAEVTCGDEVFDFATAKMPAAPATTAALVAQHDEWSARGRAAIAAMSDEAMLRSWTLKNGTHVMFTRPRPVVLRSFVMNHLIHHRAQLTVYLRLLDIPVPGLYGPTADER